MFYYKMRHTSLQNAIAVLLQNATKVHYNMRQVYCYNMRQLYYKMSLQNALLHLVTRSPCYFAVLVSWAYNLRSSTKKLCVILKFYVFHKHTLWVYVTKMIVASRIIEIEKLRNICEIVKYIFYQTYKAWRIVFFFSFLCVKRYSV